MVLQLISVPKLDWDKLKAQNRMSSGVEYLSKDDLYYEKKKRNKKQKPNKKQWLESIQQNYTKYIRSSKKGKRRRNLRRVIRQATRAYPSIRESSIYEKISLETPEAFRKGDTNSENSLCVPYKNETKIF